ncbi:GxxExxY protein [Geothrix paludis]|uniref:GxxExxY protein n=1 Tax=Geothrix paludis TaxID=2922722 RepID=UPI001FACB7FC|nr:GxxExxY protein [Geothrix paludis]
MLEDDPLTSQIIGCAYKVANELGSGFLEKVYENALAHELRKAGLNVAQQHGVQVHYDGVKVGDYVADLLVNEQILIELKACKDLDDIHLAQCLNYLKATDLKVCLLMNFGRPKIQIRRLMMDRSIKNMEPVMNDDGQ